MRLHRGLWIAGFGLLRRDAATFAIARSTFQSLLCPAIIRSGQCGRERVLVMQAVQHRADAYERSFAQMMPGSLIVRKNEIKGTGLDLFRAAAPIGFSLHDFQ
jgi:hypothetical protein